MSPRPYKHGTTTAYSRGCRCEPCRDAKVASNRRYRERRAAGITGSRPGPVPAAERAVPASPALTLVEVEALLEARARSLAYTAGARTSAGREARHRRAEVLDLLHHLREAVSAA